MNEKWILTVKTSLPNEAVDIEDLHIEGYVFDTFEAGKAKMLEIIKSFALSENAMFDGQGNITALKEYCQEVVDQFADEDEEFADSFKNIMDCMRAVALGEDFKQLDDNEVEDGEICAEFSGDKVTIFGTEDGPMNGIDPKIMTNLLDLSEPKDCCFYVNPMFNYDEPTPELYVDLIKAKHYN